MKLFANTAHRESWSRYVRRSRTKRYKKGEVILLQDHEPEFLNIVKSGIVRVYDITASGEVNSIAFDAAGEIFPIGWVFKQIKTTQYFYDAWTDVEVYQLRREDFLRYLRFHPRMGYELYVTAASRITALQYRILALEQSRAGDKVLYTLRYLAERFGKESDSKDVVELTIPLTQQDIASLIGLTRETASIELKKLERKKVIISQHKHYKINRQKLNSLMEGDV